MELYKPMPTNGVLTNKVTVADVLDKGQGAVILFDGESTMCTRVTLNLIV